MKNSNKKEELKQLNEELNKVLEEQYHLTPPSPRKYREVEKKKKKGKNSFKILVGVLSFLLVLSLAGVGGLLILRNEGRRSLEVSQTAEQITAPEAAVLEEGGQKVLYEGKTYRYNPNMIAILCMGIDKGLSGEETSEIGENGQADSIFLIALDRERGKVSMLSLSRDSMVDVNVYDTDGNFVETKNMQLCLAYAYGDGKEESCKNTAVSVSRLLYGMPVHSYAAIDLDALGILNDLAGGVTVRVAEDLTASDPALKEGETVTLNGKQADNYVRSRDSQKLDSNNQRMARQKQYFMAFLQQVLNRTKADITFPTKLYQALDGYMVTDITASEITYLGSWALEHGSIADFEMYTVPGKVEQGEEYAEFRIDEKVLYEIILKLFYERE